MASFNGNSYYRIPTREERRAQQRSYEKGQRDRVAVLSLNQKTKLLAGAIIDAAAKRGIFSQKDGIQAGLTPREVESLFPAALEVARAREPRLTDMVAA